MTTSATGASNSPASFTNKNRVTGLASGAAGFDTQGIVDSLMAIERKPYDDLDYKRQWEQLRLQAYQAVNTVLLNFRSTVSTLSSRSLWNAKTTTSTNEKSMTATANEYAVKGAYSFKVAQVAAATEYASRVVADKKAPLSPPKQIPDPKNEGKMMDGPAEKIGEINLSSAKTRVDNSAKLEQLNGGDGVFRGSIRISDSNNGTATIDLSGAVTLDDVVRTINEAGGVRVNASMRDGRLLIEDQAGGNSTLKIQNVGAGTTATDLGIAGASKPVLDENGDPVLDDEGNPQKFIHGRNVYTLGESMSLKELNDGLGVEEGEMVLTVYGKNDADEDVVHNIRIDLNGVKTVGDVMNRVNKELDTEREKGKINEALDLEDLLKNLRFGISSDGASLGFTGVQENFSYQFSDLDTSQVVGQGKPAENLGLTNDIQSAGTGDREVSFGRVLGDANSPMLKNLGGAAGTGVGEDPPQLRIPVPFNGDTLVSDLNNGEGLNTANGFNFRIREGGRDSDGVDTSAEANIIADAVDMVEFRQWLKDNPEATVNDLLTKINTEINDYASDPANNAAGLKGFNISLNPYGENLMIDGIQPGYSLEIGGGLAVSLGLERVRGDGGTPGTALELDPGLNDHDKELQDKVDEFYGMGDYSEALRPAGSNNDIDMVGDPEADPPKKGTTLGELSRLLEHGSPEYLFGDDEGITISLGTGKIGNNISYEGGDPLTVTVKWSDLTDEDGNPIEINEDTELGVLVDAMNKKLADEFAAAGYEGSVPELRLNSLASGLQWSNMDFSNYWSMSDAGSTKSLESMNLSRDWTTDLTESRQQASIRPDNKRLAPARTGYTEEVELTEDNADEVTLGQYNFGVGVSLEGRDEDTVEIEFEPPSKSGMSEEEYDGKKISFTLKELRTAVEAKLRETGKTDKSELSVQEYLDTLNGLVDEKIGDYYDEHESGTADSDRFDIGFKVGEGGRFVIDELENSNGITIGGALANYPYGSTIGLAPIHHTQEALDTYADEGTEIPVNTILGVGTMYPQTIEGLGEIMFTLDGDDSYGNIFRLQTDGLDKNSSLNDLLNTLNDQLAAMAKDPSNPNNALLADVKFVLNESGTGIAVDNGSNARLTFIDTFQLKEERDENGVMLPDDERTRLSDAQHLAQDLGLISPEGEDNTVEAYSFYNAKSLGRNYLSRATSLEDFAGKAVMDMGELEIRNAGGTTTKINMNGMSTLGDLIDEINSKKFGVRAEINARGDGITIYENYDGIPLPKPEDRQGQIGISDVDGGISLGKKLGITGTGNRDADGVVSEIAGSLTKTIEVMSTDSLEDIMYRISEAGYKTSILNDGNGWSLSVSATNTGEKNDFVLESTVPQVGFSQVKRGKDAKVLYGDPDSSGSPRMLSSETNSNSTAINGITLDLKSASAEWTTITVDDDKEQVVETVKAMVAAYNDLSNVIKQLDAYDSETGEKGILFGDNNVRTMMDDINDFFYGIYNPNNVQLGSVDSDGKQQTWTWMDMGISLSAAPSNADGTGGWYSQIDFDEDMLTNMVSSNWDTLSKMLSTEVNVANVNAADNMRPTASFNGEMDDGFSADGGINGDNSVSSFGKTNGIQGKDTIENGSNSYTIWFQKATPLERMNIYHADPDLALKDFTVEFLNSNTGQWETMRTVEGGTGSASIFGLTDVMRVADAVRITASATNAEDGKFRLANVEVFEQAGLAGQLNRHTTELGDTQFGFLKNMNDEIQSNITDIDEQMTRLQDKLTMKEEALWRRFTAMETAMGKLNSQGDYFTNMMKSLGGGQ